MPEARYLDPSKLRVTLPAEDAGARMEIQGEDAIRNVQFRLMLPLSDTNTFIAIQDSAKKEVGVLKSLDGLDPDSRVVVERMLDRQYFTPKVLTIKSLKPEGGMWHFVVETSRGPAEYYVRNWRDSAHEISSNRWLVHSVDGQRFEIPRVDNLDVQSQNLMDQLL
jgi:hypothetical protein